MLSLTRQPGTFSKCARNSTELRWTGFSASGFTRRLVPSTKRAPTSALLISRATTRWDATSYSAQGTYTIHWSYDDGNGNVSAQNQTVIVDDITAPVADVASLPDVTGECSATAAAPTATDNCEGSVTGTTTDATSYSAQGTYTIHWSYDDGNGNVSTQNQTVRSEERRVGKADISSLADVTGKG